MYISISCIKDGTWHLRSNASGVSTLHGPAGYLIIVVQTAEQRGWPLLLLRRGGEHIHGLGATAGLAPTLLLSRTVPALGTLLLFALLTGKLYNRARSFFNFGILKIPILTANQNKDILVLFSKAMISITDWVISCTMYPLNMPCRWSIFQSVYIYIIKKIWLILQIL